MPYPGRPSPQRGGRHVNGLGETSGKARAGRVSPPARVVSARRSGSAQLDEGRLELRVLVIGVERLVAADARLLVAAERHRDVAAAGRIDVDRAGAPGAGRSEEH